MYGWDLLLFEKQNKVRLGFFNLFKMLKQGAAGV